MDRPRKEFLRLAIREIHDKVFFGPEGVKDLIVTNYLRLIPHHHAELKDKYPGNILEEFKKDGFTASLKGKSITCYSSF